MKTGIIFDMDGTLWDSAKEVAQSWNLAMEQLHYEREPLTAEDMYRVMGKTMDVLGRILFPEADEKMLSLLLERCCQVENEYLSMHGGCLYEGVKETLQELKKHYDLFIVSNCQSGYIEAFLKFYQMENLFSDIECFGNNHLQKGDNIALVVRRNQLEHAIYVGDIQGDYEASQKAGVPFVHAAYGFGIIDDVVPAITKFSELPDLLEKLLK